MASVWAWKEEEDEDKVMVVDVEIGGVGGDGVICRLLLLGDDVTWENGDDGTGVGIGSSRS